MLNRSTSVEHIAFSPACANEMLAAVKLNIMKQYAELRNKNNAADVRRFQDVLTASKRLLNMPDNHQRCFQVWDIDEAHGYECHLFDGCSEELKDFVERLSS